MVVNWERSPHSAKKVKVKAWTKIGEIKCSHFFWGIAVPGPDSTSPGPFNSLVLWSCEGQGGGDWRWGETTTKQPTIRSEVSWKQMKYNSKAKASHLVAGMLLATGCCITKVIFIGHHLKKLATYIRTCVYIYTHIYLSSPVTSNYCPSCIACTYTAVSIRMTPGFNHRYPGIPLFPSTGSQTGFDKINEKNPKRIKFNTPHNSLEMAQYI